MPALSKVTGGKAQSTDLHLLNSQLSFQSQKLRCGLLI